MSDRIYTSKLNIHGINVHIDSDALSPIQGVRHVFYYFVTKRAECSTLRFFFRTLSDTRELKRVELPGMVVSSSEDMEYFFSEHKLFITVKGKFTTVVNFREKCAVAYVLRDYSHDAWLLAHQAFYPALSELLKGEGLFDIHSAALSRNGKAYLFPGKSGSGKSTTALALLLGKFMFLSDDITFLKSVGEELQVLCFPEPVHMWEDSYDFFPEVKRLVVRNFDCERRKQSFVAEKLFPDQQIKYASPSYIIFPVVSKGKCRVESLPGKEAIAELLPQSLIMANPDIVKKHLAILSNLVTQSQCFRLFLGDDIRNLPDILP